MTNWFEGSPAPPADDKTGPGPIPDSEAIQSPGIHQTQADAAGKSYPYIQADPNAKTTDVGAGSAPGKDWFAGTPAPPQPLSTPADTAIATNGYYSRVLTAFGQGFADQWGSAKLGPELKATLEKHGILYSGEGEPTIPQAFNEAFLRPAANALDVGLRSLTGIAQGLHDAAVAGGTLEDSDSKLHTPEAMAASSIAAASEAFPMMGAELGRLGWFPDRLPVPKAITNNKGQPVEPIIAYHGSPHTFDNFSGDAIGTGEGAQSYGHGLYFAENKSVAQSYMPNLEDVAAAIRGEKTGDDLKPGNLFQVKLHIDKDAMLDWDKTLKEQSPSVQAAIRKLGSVAKNRPLTDDMTGREIYQVQSGPFGFKERGERLRDAGIPGIKYLDQGSRGTGEGTHNLVVFSDKDVEITHVNDQPVPHLREAAERNVIGPDRPPLSEGTAVEAAQNKFNSMAARNPEDNSLVVKGEQATSPVAINDWQARFQHYVKKLKTTDDVKAIIRGVASQMDDFEEARAGQIPPERYEQLSDVTGVPVKDMDEAKLRSTFQNDKEFRAAGQLMLQTQDDVFEAARAHRAEGSFETRQELVASIMRRDLALEHVMGLRAEWGRTGNVMQEFLDATKDAQGLGRFIKDKKGEAWNSETVDDLAEQLGSQNSRESVRDLLNKTREKTWTQMAASWWTNAILSGPITHMKYIVANAAYVTYDAMIGTTAAGMSGLVRQMLSKEDIDRVYMGEGVMKMYGLVAGVKDALYAAGRAARDNMPAALPSQLKGAGTANVVTGQTPFGGIVGQAISGPSRAISGVHSFYNFLGYRAELEALAYRKAVKQGYRPTSPEFWRTQKAHVDFPDDDMMTKATDAGARANFVQDLHAPGKAMQSLVAKVPIGQFVLPFLKVPGNIFNAAQEMTPLAFVPGEWGMTGKTMRVPDPNMPGKFVSKWTPFTGAEKDMLYGRVAGGAAIAGWFATEQLKDNVTGGGPVDPTQRAQWLLTHQPYSFKMGGQWRSFSRFGPTAIWLGLVADATDAIRDGQRAYNDKQITEADKAAHDKNIAEATNRTVLGLTHSIDEAGFQGLFNLTEAMTDPNRSKISNVGRFAGSWSPYSALQSQTASFFDPQMRETKTFIDGIRVGIPGQRTQLPTVPDWTGAPRPNPMYHSLVQTKAVNDDVVDAEMQRLNIKPTQAQDTIKGVKLSREQNNEFQTMAGSLTRDTLEHYINQPGWQQMPDIAKVPFIEHLVKGARKQAEAAMQMKYQSLIQEGLDTHMDILTQGKRKPTAYERP